MLCRDRAPLAIAIAICFAELPLARAQGPATKAVEPAGKAATETKPVEYDLLTFYKDNYFLTGFTGETQVKFQFSGKFDLWPNEGRHAFYFGFTQKSLWNIYRPSAPFVESNYNPEIFYVFFHHLGRYKPPPGCGFFHERLGLEHESNGEEAALSRGWNRAYVESRFSCYDDSGHFGSVTLKVWAPPFGVKDNPSIVRHMGYGELAFSVGSEHGNLFGDADLTVVLRKGTNRALAEGSVQVDARWRPPYAGFWRFAPYIHAQLFTGYGETLLTYDQPTTSFRVGVGFSDKSTRSQ